MKASPKGNVKNKKDHLAKICMNLYIHTYIRLLTTSPKGLFSANYKGKDKNKNIYK